MDRKERFEMWFYRNTGSWRFCHVRYYSGRYHHIHIGPFGIAIGWR